MSEECSILKRNGFEMKKQNKTQGQCGWAMSKERRKWDQGGCKGLWHWLYRWWGMWLYF